MSFSAHDAVVDAFTEKDDKKADAEQDEAAIAEARREAEERRKEKHRKMEEEREKMRQDIRDKVRKTYCLLRGSLVEMKRAVPKNSWMCILIISSTPVSSVCSCTSAVLQVK